MFCVFCSLARAAYRRADVYLLDDPLSAVDAHVGSHLFSECIGPRGRLARQRATRILVTHQVHFLKEADWVVILKDVSVALFSVYNRPILIPSALFQGKIEHQGSPSDLSRSGVDFASLLQAEDIDESTETPETVRTRSRTQSRSSARSISSVSLHSEGNAEDEPEEVNKTKSVEDIRQMEMSSKGKVKGNLFFNYFRSGGNLVVLVIVGILFILAQVLASFADFWVSFWTSQEELRTYYANLNETVVDKVINVTQPNATIAANTTDDADVTIPYTTFFGTSILSTEMCIYIHGSLMLTLFTVAIIRSVGFYSICVNASQTLHNTMFKGLISSTMRFFDTNPSGRILNRFSKDMGAVDEYLPKAVLDATQITLSMAGAVIVTAIVNPLFLVPIGVMSIMFMFIRRVYLKTSKDIKRLEGICKDSVTADACEESH